MIFSLVVVFLLGFSAGGTINEKIRSDISLVVPGVGSERLVLQDETESIINIKGPPDRVADFEEIKELFGHVFGIESQVKIFFNKIYYYEKQKSVIFINDNRISGIAGLNNSRVTADSIDLRKGVEYFIFGYGNSRLSVLVKSDDQNRDKIYLYPDLGMALFDDRDDDIIDMHIIFPKNK